METNAFLMQQMWLLPELLMCGLGVILALVNFRKYPMAAGCALAAFILWGGSPIVNQLAFYIFVIAPRESGQGMPDNLGLMNVVRAITILATVTGYGLILFAIFGPRRESRGY